MKLVISILLLIPVSLLSQALIEDSRYTGNLKNGEKITFYAARECGNCFYYLPLNLRIAQNQNSTPEISLVTWKNDENSKVIGGILHFLVHWGVSFQEEQDFNLRLKMDMDSTAVIMGPALIQPGAAGLHFRGSDDLAVLLTSHLTAVPPVPTTPGSKMAFSFRFGEAEIGTLMNYVDNPSKTVTKLVVPYTYAIWDKNGLSTSSIQLELCMQDVLKLIR